MALVAKILALIGAVLGILIFMLGGLWFLQGADLVHIDPIACVAECEPLTGGSVEWMVSGGIAMLIGVGLTLVGVWWYRLVSRHNRQGSTWPKSSI